METFDFPISEATLKSITDMGYEKPTPIQEMTITPLLEGKDLIGQAQTGTGKTAAFGIPLVEKVDPADKNVQAIVLCPTRELAVQTAGELEKLGRYHLGLRVLAVYGGAPIERQLRELKYGVQIVVGTPGRVMDHLDRGSLDITNIKICILDEADEMLDMGFRDDIETILSRTQETRQTALFSATMPLPIMSLAQKYLRDPQLLKVENKALTVENIKQTYIQIRSFHKVELLARLLVRDNITKALVFINTKLGVEEVVTGLQSRGFAAAGLHGDMRQIERDAIMERFKGGTVDILVATDVAARGLDINDVEAVFNYDIPLDVEYYVHRIGRTGRAGKEGRAYTFVVGREISRIWDYRRITKAVILAENPPSGEDIRKAEDARFLEKALAIANPEAEQPLPETALESAKKLLENTPAENVVAALLTLLEAANGQRIHPEMDIKVPEPPRPAPAPRTAPRYGRPADNERGFVRRGPYGRPANQGDNRFDRRGPADRPYGRPASQGENRFDRRNAEPGSDRPFRKGEGRPFGKPFEGKTHDKPAGNFYDPRRGGKKSGEVRMNPPAVPGGNGKRIPREKRHEGPKTEE